MKKLIACVTVASTVVFLWIHTPFEAVIVRSDGSLSVYETAPEDDPGWDNVGIRGGGTGIYLESQWVLTAAHVGEGNIVLRSQTFSAVSGTTHRLLNADNSETDIILFRISGDPGLPSLQISEQTPSIGSDLVMIGAGRNREADVTRWDEDWKEDPEGSTEGYKWTGSRTMRWGTNTIDDLETFDVEWGEVDSLVTEFSDTEGSGQGTPGDSGGAVF